MEKEFDEYGAGVALVVVKKRYLLAFGGAGDQDDNYYPN